MSSINQRENIKDTPIYNPHVIIPENVNIKEIDAAKQKKEVKDGLLKINVIFFACIACLGLGIAAKYYLDSLSNKECSLTAYVSPDHGFVKLYCPDTDKGDSIHKVVGFYPIGGEQNEIIRSGIEGSFLGKAWDILGHVTDDYYYYYNCQDRNIPCAETTFRITRYQAEKAFEYIMIKKEYCRLGDLTKCNYRLINHNCVDFVTEVVEAAGIKENWFKLLKTPAITPHTFAKAWEYIKLKTLGDVRLGSENN